MRVLRAVMGDDAQRLAVSEYIADMTCLMARRICHADLPLYGAIKRGKHRQTDDRSAKEIIEDIIAKRRKKRGRRGGDNN